MYTKPKKLKYCEDISGKRIGIMTVIRRNYNPDSDYYGQWEVKCDCGNTRYYKFGRLLDMERRSTQEHPAHCGCLTAKYRQEAVAIRSEIRKEKTGNMFGTRLANAYATMVRSCYVSGAKGYDRIGKRGIKVYDDWYDPNDTVVTNHLLPNFCNWAIENGYTDTMVLRRYNITKDFTPDNCYWVSENESKQNIGKAGIMYDEQFYTLRDFDDFLKRTPGYTSNAFSKRHEYAIQYLRAALHTSLTGVTTLYDPKSGMYRNKDGFIVLVPKYNIKRIDF